MVVITELSEQRKATIERTQDETTWGGPAGDILTGIRNAEGAPPERAIWELVQNARDVSWEDESAIISFVKTAEGLRFIHYGKPFTNISLESLIKQTSSKVRSDIRTVGKYGTGFLVTHQFGRLIELKGKLQVVDNQEWYYPFDGFEMDRTSDDKATLKRSLKAQSEEVNSWGYDASKLENNGHGETVFFFKSGNDVEKSSLETAFKSAPAQAPYVLALNSRYIKEIRFKDEQTRDFCCYQLGNVIDKLIGEGRNYEMKMTEVVVSNNDVTEKKGIYYLVSKTTDERIDEAVVTIILPIKEKAIGRFEGFYFDNCLSKLYLSLPLIGTENWGINFIIHSPLFECENDSRNGLRVVPQGVGLAENDNRRMLGIAYEMVAEWMKNSLESVFDRKYLGRVCFDTGSKNKTLSVFYEELQKKWCTLFADSPIARNDNNEYILPKDLYVLDESLTEYAEGDESFLDATYAVLQKAYSGMIPGKQDLLFWSRQINLWKEDGLSHVLGIEVLLETIEGFRWNDQEGGLPEDWVKILQSIVCYLIKSGNESCLNHCIIPNEDKVLHDIKDLKIPAAFTASYRKVLDIIVPEEKGKFIHPLFREIGITTLAEYSEQDAKDAITKRLGELQGSVSARLKGIETDVKNGAFNPKDEKWTSVIDGEVLKAVISLFAMWTSKDSEGLENKLLQLYCEFLCIEENTDGTISKDFFTDGEQMWRTCLFEIIYQFDCLPKEEQNTRRDWLKKLLKVMKDYSSTEDYLKRFLLFPDQSGVLRYADDIYGGTGIDYEMKGYYDAIVAQDGKTIESILVDDDFAEFLPHQNVWNNQTVGGAIEDVVCKVDGYPNLEKYDKKSEVLQIVKRFGSETDEGKRWASYFKVLSEHKSRILLTFAESDSVFTLLLQPEQRLKVLSEIAANEHCEDILEKAQAALAQQLFDDADMQYKRELGLYVEKYLVEQLGGLLKENESIKAVTEGAMLTDKDVQGGQDIIVYLEKDGESKPLYYIEVKSRWSTKESVEMSRLQMETSARQKGHYALCVVDMHDYDKEKVFRKEYPNSFEEIKERIDVVTEIGEQNEKLVPFTADSRTDVHIGGEVKSIVPQDYVKQVAVGIDELLKHIAEELKNNYADH